MSNLKWFKGKINSGDIISFIYNGRRRNVIVMECPNDPGRAGKFIDNIGARFGKWTDKVADFISNMKVGFEELAEMM